MEAVTRVPRGCGGRVPRGARSEGGGPWWSWTSGVSLVTRLTVSQETANFAIGAKDSRDSSNLMCVKLIMNKNAESFISYQPEFRKIAQSLSYSLCFVLDKLLSHETYCEMVRLRIKSSTIKKYY